MHGRRTTKVLAAAVVSVLVAGVVAATASVADEVHDTALAPVVPGVTPTTVASSTVVDEQARILLAERASRAEVRTAEVRADALAAKKARLKARKQARKAKQRARAERRAKQQRRQKLRERRALAPRARAVRPGTARAIGRKMARQDGFGSWWQWNCLDALWTAESGWRTSASNGRTGAYGIPQAYPGTKMASHGSDWRTSARTQISWGLAYIDGRYSSPCGAYSHFKRHRWY